LHSLFIETSLLAFATNVPTSRDTSTAMVIDHGRFDREVQPAPPEAVRSSSYQQAQSARIVTVRVIGTQSNSGADDVRRHGMKGCRMQQPNAAAYLGSRKLRSLLVEPDSQMRQTIELAMSVRGHEVVDCTDAPSALTTFHDNLFHLIIISSGLPDGDALRLCRDIRALPGGDETTIVLLSAAPSEDERVAVAEAGADDYIGWTTEDELLSDHLDRAERLARNRPQPGQTTLYGSSERFMVINPDGSIREAAPVAERLLGFPPAAILGVNAFSFFHPDDAPQLLSVVTGAFTQPGQTRTVEVRVRRDGDSWQTIAISAVNKTADPHLQGVVIDLRGPDARVGIDDQVNRAGMHDHLTDLPNRSLFIDRVDHAVVRSARRQQPVVVMAIDFNDLATDVGRPEPGSTMTSSSLSLSGCALACD